jgi:two-component system chemotaxis response regulator CheB
MSVFRVLVVDDTIVYRRVLSDAVKKTGMASEIHTASSGDLALERLAHEAYHVVILDVFMPGKDGLQTLQEIMQLYPATRVIMSSAMAKEAEDLTVRALEMGAVDFIVKPAEARPEANVEKIKQRLQELFLQLQVEVLGRNKGASRTTINPALNSTPLPIRRDSFFRGRFGVDCGFDRGTCSS